MNVAVGRLTLTIAMTTTPEAAKSPAPVFKPTLEDAFMHDRTYRAVESDRSRWADSYRQLRGPIF